MSATRFLAACLVMLLTQAASAADGIEHSSERRLTATVGGGAGEWLRTECEDGYYLAGFAVRYGNWIDAVGLNCAKAVNHSGVGRLEGPGSSQILMWGGQGGADGSTLCGIDQGVAGVRLQKSPNNFLGYIELRCTYLNDPGNSVGKGGGAVYGRISDKSPTPEIVDCPIGMIAVGIHGATGNYVDRLGLVCAPAPKFFDQPDMADRFKSDGGVADSVKTPIDPNSEIERQVDDSLSNVLTHCRKGFVPRKASASDEVCVEPESRDRVAQENAGAAALVDPNGAWGPQSCVSGFVWREAFDGDLVCVTPQIRELVRQENQLDPSRRK